ncbi:MAG TPA: pitrilysin family protein [Brumimicrobium sp.]|nr:pitrilysin family protein [Brumimicrobium sp.]
MKIFLSLMLISTFIFGVNAQKNKIDFVEYDLDNGMHVILHKDNSTPIIAVSVLYHVGSKNEDPERTGFAHFFEHLMFEGSQNIERGEFDKYIKTNGGELNAYTSYDVTYYHESFTSNNLELGLWLESERLLHAKVDDKGIETQREVVKEEKRLRIDNQPYATFIPESFSRLYKEHPYHWPIIGSMDHLDAAQEEDYVNFYKTFYTPSNATLSIAGDIDIEEAKAMINKYFNSIPKGQAINLYRDYLALDNKAFTEKYGKDKSIFDEKDFFNTKSKEGKALIAEYAKKETVIERPTYVEPKLTEEIVDTIYDNIQLPALIASYQAPAQNSKDAYAVEMLHTILSEGASSRLNKSITESKELTLQFVSGAFTLEHPGMSVFFAIANMGVELNDIKVAFDEEMSKVQNELISEKEFQKLKNQYENDFYSSNSSVAGVAENLAKYHVLYENTDLINEQMNIYNEISREDIKRVANQYFDKNGRVILYYLPKK